MAGVQQNASEPMWFRCAIVPTVSFEMKHHNTILLDKVIFGLSSRSVTHEIIDHIPHVRENSLRCFLQLRDSILHNQTVKTAYHSVVVHIIPCTEDVFVRNTHPISIPGHALPLVNADRSNINAPTVLKSVYCVSPTLVDLSGTLAG